MWPVLVSIGSFHLYSFSVFLILAWVVWSFLFWRYLRSLAVTEERIFDCMFYVTIMALIGSRLFFVVTHIPLFSENWLRVVALWIQPGLSLPGALVTAVVTFIFLSITYKVRIAHLLDGFAVSFVAAGIIGSIGAFLDGSSYGKLAGQPWAVPYVGVIGRRHPVELYLTLGLIAIAVIIGVIRRISEKRKWPYGILSMWFFTLFSILFFTVELFREHDVYWGRLSANQWIMVGIFAESLGAFYVRGGGKERLRTTGRVVGTWIKEKGGKIYAKFPKRHT